MPQNVYPSEPKRRYGKPSSVQVRWSALATGSLIGIAAWATAYILGGALALVIGIDLAIMSTASCVMLGVYGALSASAALALAAYTAARTGGAHSKEHALFYGACLWSMSTITLVTLTTCASAGLFNASMMRSAAVVAVGLSAVASLPQQQGLASAAGLAATSCTLLISLALALWGSLKAVQGPP